VGKVYLVGGATLKLTATGAAHFVFQRSYNSFTGDIAAGQTVEILGEAGGAHQPAHDERHRLQLRDPVGGRVE
jgi:hypothetical protein